jgi:hypothetical protein
MSSRKEDLTTGVHTIPSPATRTGELSVEDAARDEKIRHRAYEIYLERGEQPGRELDDWLQAERELIGVLSD